MPRPLVVIDTSVFVADALSHQQRDVSVLGLAAAGIVVPVSSEGLREEILEKLVGLAALPEEAVIQRYGEVWEQTHWVEPVVETSEHVRFVAGDADDTILIRSAEAAYTHLPEDLLETPDKFIVSLNTRHLRPGSNWAGFKVCQPHAMLRDIA